MEVGMQTLVTLHRGNQDRLQALPQSSPDPSTMKPTVFSVTKRCGNIYCTTLLGTPVHLIIHANSQSAQDNAQCIYATEASSRADLNTQRVPLNLEDDQQQNLSLRLCFSLNPNPMSVYLGSKYILFYVMAEAFLKLYLAKYDSLNWSGCKYPEKENSPVRRGVQTENCFVSIFHPFPNYNRWRLWLYSPLPRFSVLIMACQSLSLLTITKTNKPF